MTHAALTFQRAPREAVAAGHPQPHGIVGTSRAVARLIERIDLVASARSTVLITGETGTGKELVARAIHNRGTARLAPFVNVNCAAIPETLIESELFGHVKGAFTGASATKRGKFALAHGGSIFLDEIGTMAVGPQSRLLRVLQEREIEPLGSERSERIDVRVIAATNRDLQQLVSEGRFLPDLFYRLHVVPIEVPPLRERVGDIPALVAHFIEKHAARCGKAIDGVDERVIALLATHPWPGNVRELENTIERAVVLATGRTIAPDVISVPADQPIAAAAMPSLKLHQNVRWVECETIRRALAVSRRKGQAATLMGITPRALSHYLHKYPFIDQAHAGAEPS
jgi:transcriptional regulator with GAF, ATPase, and Fis domain